MEITQLIDLESIAKQLKLPLPGVQRTAELLEEGNTVPFITRFRRDQTGGLDEQQIRIIESELKRAKLLAERKETILKSIESRGKLTDKLASQIKKAKILGDLEDIYLPYKPKKQSLASVARARGLEPLANAILEAKEATPTLEERAAEFVNAEKEVPDVETALEGLKHLIAEYFGHNRQVRSHLRRHLSKHGKLVCKKIDQPNPDVANEADGPDEPELAEPSPAEAIPAEGPASEEKSPELKPASEPTATGESVDVTTNSTADNVNVEATTTAETTTESTPASVTPEPGEDAITTGNAESSQETAQPAAESSAPNDVAAEVASTNEAETTSSDTKTDSPAETEPSPTETEPGSAENATSADEGAAGTEKSADDATAKSSESKDKKQEAASKKEAANKKKEDATSRRDQRREMRRKRRERLVQSFKDYFDFSDPVGRLPHHRILAINRGERTKVLRVKIECPDWDKVQAQTENVAVREDHPHAGFLKECLQDAMQRLLQPSIEREVRRDLNDRAEEHAVTVFARNLRKLLLQPPLRNHRVVAIDPGFRSGCKVVAVDQFGRMLGHTFINLLGKDQQKQSGREALANFVKEHKATVIAVGNGAASRETETLVAEVLGVELKDQQVGYLIVNEAGTSVYSTSELGREELPDVDATVRSAVSIGRRAIDPLSELVKIDPASIGVGLYQHDVKAKHLRESLDNVVESCVNYVGVNVNSASPALLGYVSGLNSLTARKIYEHRVANGPFKNREQLKEVSGIGESTYVQAAGFLRVVGGENPLDGTWIHPESYEAATKVLEAIGCELSYLRTVKASEPEAVTATATATATEDSSVTTTETAGSTTESKGEVTTGVVEAAPEATGAPDSTTEQQPETAGQASSEQPAAPDQTATETTTEAKAEQVADVEPAPEVATEPATSTPEPTESTADVTDKDSAADAASQADLSNSRMQEVREKLAAVNVDELAQTLGVGKLSLEDMLTSLARPGRDPREDLPPPIFRTGVLKLEDLKANMELSGTVLNVVDFGAFVDIGLVDSGLIHVSRLADRYISDPHDVVSVGDILRVWVVEVDQKRRRVSLTAIEPRTEKPKAPKESRRRGSGSGSGGGGGRRESSQGGDKPQGRSSRGRQQQNRGKKFSKGKGQRNQYRPKAPPKPVVPITTEMEEGKEPMRTFGDLKQLFEKKKKPKKK